MADFNIDEAKRAGATEDELFDYLSKTRSFDVDAALKAGASKRDLIEHMSTMPPTDAMDAPPRPAAEKFMDNIVQSGARFLGDTANTIAHPLKTAGAIVGLASPTPVRISPDPKVPPVGGPEGRRRLAKFYGDRYGSLDSLKRTAFEDPVGLAADVSTIATATGGALRGLGAVAKAADASRVAEVIGGAARTANQVADWANPLTAPTRLGAAAASKILPPRLATPLAENLYQGALAPPVTMPDVERTAMVRTGLREAIPVSRGGLRKTRARIKDINDRVQQAVSEGAARGETVDPQQVARFTDRPRQRFSEQVNQTDDLQAIDKSEAEFLQKHSTEAPYTRIAPSLEPESGAFVPAGSGTTRVVEWIPLDKAHAEKQGTYRKLSDSAYGEQSTAAKEAQKALARGLREAVYERLRAQLPEIDELGLTEGALIDLEDSLARAVGREANRKLLSLGTVATSAAGGAAGGVPGAVLGAAAKAFLDNNPWIKSRVAIALAKRRGAWNLAPIRRGLTFGTSLATRPPELSTPGSDR